MAVQDGGTLYVDRAALREELAATAGVRGITGILSCDEFGDCGTGHVNIYLHTDSAVTDPLNYRGYTTSRREATRARNSPVVVHSS